MRKFTTEFNPTLKHGSDTVWILNSPLVFGEIKVPAGFETDLASVPRVPIIYALWGARAHREAVIHDFLFRKDSDPLMGFIEANKVFLEAMKSRGKPFYIRYPMYWGVCIGSYGCFHKRVVKAIL